MDKCVTSTQMKRIDSINIKQRGVPSIILMERAGKEVAKELVRLSKFLSGKKRAPRVAVFCGKGNNGGDGLVCARYLLSSKIDVEIYLLCKLDRLSSEAGANALALNKQGVTIHEIDCKLKFLSMASSFSADIIVDSIFGIGFKGMPKGYYGAVIEFINSQKACIVSVDVPSGLDATTGIARAEAIIADQTITMGFSKTGFYKNDGPTYCGKIMVVDIGLKR